MKLYNLFWVLGFVFFCFAIAGEADDVYNFYFQKGPGPQTVIQGGGATPAVKNAVVQSASSNPTEEPTPTETAPPPAATAAPAPVATSGAIEPYKKWEFMVGGAKVSDSFSASSGLALGVQYNLSPYFGFQAKTVFANPTKDRTRDSDESYCGQNPLYCDTSNRKAQEHYVVGNLGVVVTPLHLNLFGHSLLTASVSAGAMNTRDSLGNGDFKQKITPYWGVGTEFHLNPNFGIGIEAQWEPNPKYGQAMALLKMKL